MKMRFNLGVQEVMHKYIVSFLFYFVTFTFLTAR